MFVINPDASVYYKQACEAKCIRLNQVNGHEPHLDSVGLSVVLGVLSVVLRAELTDSSGSKRSTWGSRPDVSSRMWVRFSKRDEKGRIEKEVLLTGRAKDSGLILEQMDRYTVVHSY